MRILMINNEYPPLGGGMATANQELIRVLLGNSSNSIDLVTAAYDRARIGEEQVSDAFRIFRVRAPRKSIHHATICNLLMFMFTSFFRSCRLLRQEPKYDVILAWAAIPAGVTAVTLRALFGIPVVTRISGPELPEFESRYQRINWLLKPLLRKVLGRSSAVVCKSSREIELIHSFAPKIAPIVIPNAAPHYSESLVERDESGPFTILCVGRIIERKGQHLLLKAIASLGLEHFQIRFAGTGDHEVECRRLSQDLNLSSNVEFLGYVEREKMQLEYALADVMVLASENEGMSFAVLEAMSAGLPIITTKGRGAEELVEDGENGYLVDWNDTSGLGRAIQMLYQYRTLAKEMGKKSRVRAAAFSWNEISARFEEVFEQVARDSRGKMTFRP